MAGRRTTLTKQQRAWVEHARQCLVGKDRETRRRFLRGFRHGTQEPEDEAFQTEMGKLVDEG